MNYYLKNGTKVQQSKELKLSNIFHNSFAPYRDSDVSIY